MRRVAILSLVIFIAGVWLEPHLSSAGEVGSENRVVAAAAPASSQPTTQPAGFKNINGATGFWRLAQSNSGVWWFLSPDDKPEFLNSVTTVQPFQIARD
jgi:hypothetical protein